MPDVLPKEIDKSFPFSIVHSTSDRNVSVTLEFHGNYGTSQALLLLALQFLGFMFLELALSFLDDFLFEICIQKQVR